jgi:hypothetical protein
LACVLASDLFLDAIADNDVERSVESVEIRELEFKRIFFDNVLSLFDDGDGVFIIIKKIRKICVTALNGSHTYRMKLKVSSSSSDG